MAVKSTVCYPMIIIIITITTIIIPISIIITIIIVPLQMFFQVKGCAGDGAKPWPALVEGRNI